MGGLEEQIRDKVLEVEVQEPQGKTVKLLIQMVVLVMAVMD